MSAIERKYGSRRKTEPQEPEKWDSQLSIGAQFTAQELNSLAKKLSPPSSGKGVPFRPIHPDLVVFVFSLIAPLFLYRIITNQPSILPLIAIILVGFYGFYGYKRISIISRFEAQIQAQKMAEARIQNGIKRWMQLYYCARDDIVFNPLDGANVSVDLVTGYLMQD